MLSACSGGDGKYKDAVDFARPAGSDATVREDVAVGGSASCCPDDSGADLPSRLIPRPVSLFELGEPATLGVAALSRAGETAPLVDEFHRMTADFGFAEAQGGLHVTVHTDEEWAGLRVECGFDVPDRGAYFLSVDVQQGTATAHIFGDDAGRFFALKTLRQLLEVAPLAVRPARVLDHSAAPIRGVVEGFYGPPWSHEDRLTMLPLMADLKMNTFVYAPKDDIWINVAWMQPYPEAELQHIRELVEAAAAQRIQLCWELHIGWALSFSSQADMDLMVAKFDSVGQQGVGCFVVAFDDVTKFMSPADEKAYDGYAEAQADFTNRLAQELLALYPGAMLAFVPVEYWTDHEDTQTDLAYLGESLRPEWMIAWTGRKIVSTTITEVDTEQINALLQRPAFLGDNYPVSDAGAAGEVLLGPLVGRELGVATLTSGSVFNPMPLPFASLPALATTADWAWNPLAYDPLHATSNAALLYAGAANAAAANAFFLANRSPILESSNAPELQAAMDELWIAWESAGDVTGTALVLRTDFLGLYLSLEQVLGAAGLHPALQELVPWMEAQVQYSQACLTAVDLLTAAAAGTPPSADDLAALQVSVGQLAALPHRATGPVMQDFLERCMGELGVR